MSTQPKNIVKTMKKRVTLKDTVQADTLYVGLDIGKSNLVFAYVLDGQKYGGQVNNTPAGRNSFLQRIRKAAGPRRFHVIMESTGAYSEPVRCLLDQEQVFYTLENACRTHNFAKSLGALDKDDARDALMLARYGAMYEPAPTRWRSPWQYDQRALVRAAHALARHKGRILQMLEDETMAAAEAVLRDVCNQLDEQICELWSIIKRAVCDLERTKRLYETLTSVVGVGDRTALTLIVMLPELGLIGSSQIAKLVGLCPVVNQSGDWEGETFIQGGRRIVRGALFNATRSACLHNKVLAQYLHHHMADLHHHYMTARIACARKLLIHLNSLAAGLYDELTSESLSSENNRANG